MRRPHSERIGIVEVGDGERGELAQDNNITIPKIIKKMLATCSGQTTICSAFLMLVPFRQSCYLSKDWDDALSVQSLSSKKQ